MGMTSKLQLAGAAASIAKREAAQERVLLLLAEGLSPEKAMNAIGQTKQSYYMWCQRYPDFARRANDVLQQHRLDREAGKSDDDIRFEAFRLKYFHMVSMWHMVEMIRAIENSPGGSFILILLPPEWGKTTLIEDYICYRLAQDPNQRFVHISQSQGHARKVVGRIQRRMLDTSTSYVQKFGPFKADERIETKPWNAGFFTVARSGHDERDYSLEAKGAGSQIQGARAEIIFLDDIQSRNTLNLTPKLLDYIRQEIITRPGKTGKIVMVGTRVEFADIYEAVLNEDIVDVLVQIPALNEKGKSNFPPAFDLQGKAILDERGHQLGWSEADLDRRMGKVGPQLWDRTYMQKPESRMGPPFPEEILQRALDHNRIIGEAYVTPGKLAGLDPALGGIAAFTVCGYDARTLWLLDIEAWPGLGRVEQIFDILERLTERHHPDSWIIETESLQKGYINDDRLLALAARQGFVPIPHLTHGKKFDAIIGVASMAGAFSRGEIRFPYGDEYSRRQSDALLAELRAWRPDIPPKLLKQDRIMSLWFCYVRWLAVRENLYSTASMWQRRGINSLYGG